MQRDEWAFGYTAKQLADAALAKKQHHEERLKWWQEKQQAVIDEVKDKGLEVSQQIASEYAVSQAIRGAQLVVKNDYQQKLNECHMKIQSHGARAKEYDGWHQMLSAQLPTHSVSLDVEDFLFFFGK